jgi:hypothetical protein
MSNWPNVTKALRDYLRADTGVSALVGNRVFFGIPDRVAFPLVTVTRVAGGQDAGEAPIDRPIMQLDCWGIPGNGASAEDTANAVKSALEAIKGRTSLNADCVAFGASVMGAPFFPDPETGQPRVVLTVDMTAHAVPA